jgi:hypothetical protein
VSLKSWLQHRKEERAKRVMVEHVQPKKKRHLGLKISTKIFLASHLALYTLYPPSIYEFKLQDMSAGAIAQQFNLSAKKLGERPTDFPAYQTLPTSYQMVLEASAKVAKAANGEQFYNQLPARYKADVLNLFSKSDMTWLPDGSSVMDHLQCLREIDQDRIFASVDSKLAPAMDASVKEGVFNHRGKMDASLHHASGKFSKYASYKTYDQTGNLDITLSHDGKNWMAEIDIDYYKGVRHFFLEVMYHHAFDQRTDPYHVGRILRDDQGIDPGYRPK